MSLRNLIYGTDPVMVHFPGAFLPGMALSRQMLCGLLNAPPVRVSEPPRNVAVVTWNSRQSPSSIEEQCAARGVLIRPLGRGVEPFHWGMKGVLLTEFARTAEEEFVLAVDGFDAVLQGDIYRCVSALRATPDCDALFGGEACFAFGSDAERRFEESLYKSPFRYLNAGLMIARAEFLRALSGIDWGHNDQTAWHRLHRDLHPRVQIDHKCVVFQNVNVHPDVPLDKLVISYGPPRDVASRRAGLLRS